MLCEPLDHVTNSRSFFVHVRVLCYLHAISQFAMLVNVVAEVLSWFVREVPGFSVEQFVALCCRCVDCVPYYVAYCARVVSEDVGREHFRDFV